MKQQRVKLSENSYKVLEDRYLYKEIGEGTWEDVAERVSKHISMVEENEKREKYFQEFYEVIAPMFFIPAGRILRNSGRPDGNLFNCFCLPIGDSIEEIGQHYKDSLILWSNGGGVGTNFSPLRPKGDVIMGKGGKSSGLVSFIEGSDYIAKRIESGGSRRAAALALVDISHPEVIDFMDSKLVHGKLSHFNISVVVNNEFLNCVEEGNDWNFKFKQKVYGSVNSKDLWNKIMNNMISCGEPGLLNWSNFIKNNSYYFAPVISPNPCGEVPLSSYECCCLGSLVLPNFITGNVNTNWKKLEQVIKTSIRFLDNVIDASKYALKENDINSHNGRRIGLGVLGLAEYLFSKKIRYGSQKAVYEVERLMRFIRDVSYQASNELAREKGAFPKFDNYLYSRASFVKKLPAQLRSDIKRYGQRNVTTMAHAPGGSISLLTNFTSGIEPLFSKGYRRADRIGDRIYIHDLYKNFILNNEEIPEWYVDTFDLKPEEHLEIQSATQKFTDGSVSKTINLPEETTSEDLSNVLLEYIRDIKGVTVYRDKSRGEQVLFPLEFEEIKNIIYDEKIETTEDLSEEDVSCANGSCEI